MMFVRHLKTWGIHACLKDSWRDSEGQSYRRCSFRSGQVQKAATDHQRQVFSTLRGKDKNEKLPRLKFIQADASNADDQLAR